MAKYEIRGNQNYAAQVIRVNQLIELPGLDNLRGVPLFGYTALVGKDTPIGSLMVAFVAETQVSVDFAREFNLFRKSELNADVNTTGYLEDNRRIRAIKLRGNPSNALLLPVWLPDMTEGLMFDTIDGVEICRKYVRPQAAVQGTPKQPKKDKIFDAAAEALPEHSDTAQYLRNADRIPDDTHFIVSQKLHGTSVRFARAEVPVELNWLARFAKRLGVPVKDTRSAFIVGSRRVIKSVEGSGKESSAHWYAEGDLWSSVARRFEDRIPEDVAVYGEIVGWVPDSQTPIQPNYTYGFPVGQAEFFAYRVVANGYDLSDAGMREFCAQRGIRVVPKLWEGPKIEFLPERWMDKNFADIQAGHNWKFFPDDPVPLAKESPVDEGVVVKIEGINPTAYKVKGPRFLQHETALIDKDAADMEEAG